MIATVRFGTLVGLLVFCVACDAQPGPSTAPTPPTSYCTHASATAVWSSFEWPLDYLSFQRAD